MNVEWIALFEATIKFLSVYEEETHIELFISYKTFISLSTNFKIDESIIIKNREIDIELIAIAPYMVVITLHLIPSNLIIVPSAVSNNK